VSGSARPETAKPVPVKPLFERATLALPELVKVTVCEALEPVVTLPKLSELGEAESCSVCATPVPDTEIANEGLGELLAKVTLPETAPADVGAKLTVNAEALPGAMVSGRVRPDSAKTLPETVACVSVRLAEPGFVMVTVCELVMPSVTLPKATEVGVTEISGCMPVPLRAIVVGEFVALLLTVRLPVALPTTDGAKSRASGRLWPGERLTLAEKPLSLNAAFDEATCEMVTVPDPVLVRVIDCDEEAEPTSMLPKAKLLVLDERRYVTGSGGATPVPLTEMVLTTLSRESITIWIRPLYACALFGTNVTEKDVVD
jgi:hypothetical protein